MLNQSRNSAKRKLIEDENPEESKKLDKSLHLLRICDEFADDEADVDEESDKRKEKYLENLRNEIIEWKKLLTESRELGGSNGSGGSGGSSSSIGCENDLSQDVLKDYERILSAEQLQYVRSAVDYNKWLSESNEFRKRIAYYLAKRKYSNMLATDFEEEVLSRIEAVAARDYAENFALHHLPL